MNLHFVHHCDIKKINGFAMTQSLRRNVGELQWGPYPLSVCLSLSFAGLIMMNEYQ